VPFAIGLAIIVFGVFSSARLGLRAARGFSTFLGLGLEFLLAAGLLRLSTTNTFAMLGTTAAIIATRRVVLLGLTYGVRATR
jgi:hypothetical protein